MAIHVLWFHYRVVLAGGLIAKRADPTADQLQKAFIPHLAAPCRSNSLLSVISSENAIP
jgi:hypothetical protein